MKKLIALVTLLMTATAFAQKNIKISDTNFDAFKERFILAYWQQNPAAASSNGFHNYDSVLNVPNAAYRNKIISFCKLYIDSITKFNINQLSSNNKTDYAIMQSELQSIIWYTTTLKSYEWNPAQYNISGGFAVMLENNYAPINERLRNFNLKLKNVSAYYLAAKENLKNPTIEHTKLGIEQNTGGLSTFNEDLKKAIATATLNKTEEDNLLKNANDATAAINDYIYFLKNFSNDKPRSFRLGKTLYNKKFEYDIASSYTALQIFEIAKLHKAELHVQMYAITKKLWPTYLLNEKIPADTLVAIKKLIDVLSLKHANADSFQTAIEQQIPTLTKFIADKNLLYLDPSKPLVVRKEPAYMAGVAGASISSPGPYDKAGNTYYNVGSFSGWDSTRIESYLREYNYYVLQILNIHEALPGHYAQLVYANKSPSIIKSIFGNGAMIEGWAVYTEKMMLENGYGNIAGNSENEMMLMYCKWNLRSTCNTILDYNVHVNNLSKDDAIIFLTKEAFQQKAEAEGKWKRVSLTQVQLTSYFTGYTVIYNLRESLKKKEGKKFNLKAFHEKFLSYGSAPVKYIKALMMP